MQDEVDMTVGTEDDTKVTVEGPLPQGATLESSTGWQNWYRVRRGDKVTQWGLYESIFYIDGIVYYSPYWGGANDWVGTTPEEALRAFAKCEEIEIAEGDVNVEG